MTMAYAVARTNAAKIPEITEAEGEFATILALSNCEDHPAQAISTSRCERGKSKHGSHVYQLWQQLF